MNGADRENKTARETASETARERVREPLRARTTKRAMEGFEDDQKKGGDRASGNAKDTGRERESAGVRQFGFSGTYQASHDT